MGNSVTFKEQMIARILLILARMLSDDLALSKELSDLKNHIQVHGVA
jgi:hypothetical protein